MRSSTRHQELSANPETIEAVSPDFQNSPGEKIRRRRVSKAEYKKKKKARFIVSLMMAVLPFALFITGLSLISIGIFRYVEQESPLSLFLNARKPAAAGLHGAGWDQSPVTVTPSPTETAAEPVKPVATNREGRLITPFFYIGDQFGTIRIPSVKIEVKAFQGDSEQEFRKGAGHFTGSYLPGQDGNILIAGHRTSYFRNFEYLKINDLVHFDTTYGRFTYQVREFRIISGNDASIADQTGKEQLTMYTCYPFTYVGNAPKRYVVFCDLIEKAVQT